MERKKIVVILVISIVVIGTLIALIPVFLYGFRVKALSLDMGFGRGESVSSAATKSYETMDFEGGSSLSVDVDTVEMNPYDYFFRQDEIQHEGTTSTEIFEIYIDFVIYINITSPNDQFYQLSFTLEDLINAITQDINILLGPDEIEIVNGTYVISIGVEVTISIPDVPPDGYEETFYFGPYTFYIDVIVE